MTKFIKAHNQWINEMTKLIDDGQTLPDDALDYHQSKVSYLQHERLIHLLILIFVGLVLITLFVTVFFVDILALYGLLLIILILFAFYIRHYYLLENTVQRWYMMTERIMKHRS